LMHGYGQSLASAGRVISIFLGPVGRIFITENDTHANSNFRVSSNG
jgi:hypothetical protein